MAPDENIEARLVALATFQPPMGWLKVAPLAENMDCMVDTDATFQLEMSWLKAEVPYLELTTATKPPHWLSEYAYVWLQ